MSNNIKEEEKSAIDEIATFSVSLHGLPPATASPEEIGKFINEMPFSEEEKKAFQEARERIEEENKSVKNET